MAFYGEDFVKQVPSSLAPVFQFAAIPASGLEVWLENLSADNSITWKFQDSDDGVTWVDRSFNTTDCHTTAASFLLQPGASQSVRITRKKEYTRLVASALSGTFIQIHVGWQKPVSLTSVLYLQG